MATQFGDRVRELRVKQNLLLRQIASKLEVDTSIISKIERGERPIKKEQIPILADILKVNITELVTLWLSDKIIEVVNNEETAVQSLELTIKRFKKKKFKC